MRTNRPATVDARHLRGWLTSLLAVASLGAGSQEIRDRQASWSDSGHHDHGVFITTSKFTKSATESSYKKGAITILLLDGDAIAELMLERGIGVVKQPDS